MSGRYLLDTNIVIALFANEAVVHQKLSAATEVFIPSIVLGELYYGAYKSLRVASNITRVNEFAASNSVLVCDTETAQHYGQI
jgi:tRNA(fMet)-specific endonuclease VapC